MIIPSIDLRQGKAVQLRQGKTLVLEKENPLALAEEFHRYGPLAVIDLDAALGLGSNSDLIRKLCQRYECRVGGGIRTAERASDLLSAGAAKTIIGSAAWKEGRINHGFLRQLKEAVGADNLILALDCYGEEVVIKGWTENTGLNIFKVIPEVSEYVSEFLVTAVDREGCLEGTNLGLFEKIKQESSLPVTAAGGITTVEEIATLSRLEMDVQLGMSIYSGKISLNEAFLASLNWQKVEQGLLPTVVADEAGQVLMLAWSSPESLKESLLRRQACFHSRSRDRLWVKGETSGNFQKLIRVRSDCDGDSLLFVVRQIGNGACHKRRKSCFGFWPFSLFELQDIIRDRLKNNYPGSYTASLDDRTVREKLVEEAGELIMARTPEEIIWETSDLIYFLTVLLARENIDLTRILGELRRRRRSSQSEKNSRAKD